MEIVENFCQTIEAISVICRCQRASLKICQTVCTPHAFARYLGKPLDCWGMKTCSETSDYNPFPFHHMLMNGNKRFNSGVTLQYLPNLLILTNLLILQYVVPIST